MRGISLMALCLGLTACYSCYEYDDEGERNARNLQGQQIDEMVVIHEGADNVPYVADELAQQTEQGDVLYRESAYANNGYPYGAGVSAPVYGAQGDNAYNGGAAVGAPAPVYGAQGGNAYNGGAAVGAPVYAENGYPYGAAAGAPAPVYGAQGGNAYNGGAAVGAPVYGTNGLNNGAAFVYDRGDYECSCKAKSKALAGGAGRLDAADGGASRRVFYQEGNGGYYQSVDVQPETQPELGNRIFKVAGFDIKEGQQMRKFFDDFEEPMHARYVGNDVILWTYYVNPQNGKIVRYCELGNYAEGSLCKLNVEFYRTYVRQAFSDCQ